MIQVIMEKTDVCTDTEMTFSIYLGIFPWFPLGDD